MYVTNVTTKDISFTVGGNTYVLKPNVRTYVDDEDITANDLINAYGNNIVIEGGGGGDEPEEGGSSTVVTPNQPLTKDTIYEITDAVGTVSLTIPQHAILGSNSSVKPTSASDMQEIILPDAHVGETCIFGYVKINDVKTTATYRIHFGMFRLNPIPKYIMVLPSANYTGDAKVQIANCTIKEVTEEEQTESVEE